MLFDRTVYTGSNKILLSDISVTKLCVFTVIFSPRLRRQMRRKGMFCAVIVQKNAIAEVGGRTENAALNGKNYFWPLPDHESSINFQ